MMPLAWKSLRTPAYDTVVTSSHAFARYLPAARAARVHLSYVYTPLRYAWLPAIDDRVARPWLAPARMALRRLDRRTVDDVTEFAGISRAVCDRIGEYYGREARVIYPPVDIDFFRADDQPVDRRDRTADEEPYLLGFSRWIPYKRLDLVIAAGERLGMPVVIAGHGPGEPDLRAQAERASVPVRLECKPSDERLRELYRNAAAFVFPAEEDFGIVPVECQAAGTPVVAYARGGSLDTVRDGVTGALVESQDADAFADGTRRALALSLDSTTARGHVEQFSSRAFRRSFATWVSEWVDDELAA
jgi:glycosyltransferase involved in cell wall biosynthesis